MKMAPLFMYGAIIFPPKSIVFIKYGAIIIIKSSGVNYSTILYENNWFWREISNFGGKMMAPYINNGAIVIFPPKWCSINRMMAPYIYNGAIIYFGAIINLWRHNRYKIYWELIMAPYFKKTINFGGKIIHCNIVWRHNQCMAPKSL